MSIASAGEFAPLLQLGLRNAIQPTCQSLSVVVQAGDAAPADELIHIVTHVFRFTASFRALSTLPVNSFPRLVSLLRTMKSRTAGAARLPSIAAKARATSNSINVKPRKGLWKRFVIPELWGQLDIDSFHSRWQRDRWSCKLRRVASRELRRHPWTRPIRAQTPFSYF